MDKKPIFSLDPDQLKRLFSLGASGQDPAEEQQPQANAPGEAEAPPAGEVPSADVTASVVGLEQLGGRIGPYKPLRILGEGGMGMVYLAEQEGPIRRKVALKIIKPGMDSQQVIARFEAERQALALLNHPNVAHVYDAGTTETGRPYFAMEYVKGVPITEHCDRQKLTIEERLKLFVQVCEAIQHAHQKGIIHRDIKPSNIQVCIQGEQAIPKVIDFGVAKALSQPLTERTLVTEQGQLIGTPEYISPEQAEMTNQDIDTRSDIYSLGVLLYELLTGTLPFESQTLRRGSLEQMRAVLREEEPKTPSTRVSSLDAETSTKLAKSCQSDAATLRRKLRGDLDWITLKAMEKDRVRRYQTAHALAEDIERHLKQEPVSAGRPGTLYRFQKLVRRNKGVFAAAAVVAAVLVLGALVSTWQAVRATQAKRAESHLRQQVQAEAYASDMSLAQQALAMNDLGRARRLLEAHQPAAGEVDLRGWEWRYLWQECRSDALSELSRHSNSVNSVAYASDGKMLAAAGLRQTFVEIWDVPGRRRIVTLQTNEGHLVAFSPRGDLLAADNNHGGINIWQATTGNLVRAIVHPDGIKFLKFSPDGTRLASLNHAGEVAVWEVDGWALIRRVAGAAGRSGHDGALDFSPNGRALVVGHGDGKLRVVDLDTGSTSCSIQAHKDQIMAVAWSPKAPIFASGSGFSSGPIQLWDADSGKSIGPLEGHTSWICKLIFSADGRWLYSASADQTIRIWDVQERRCLAILHGSSDEVYALALSPDGTTLASGSKDGVVAFWSALPHSKEQQPRLLSMEQGVGPAFAPDSRVLAVPREGIVHLYGLPSLREIEPLSALGTDVSTVVYSPDGTLIVSGSRDGQLRVWSCVERRLLHEWPGHSGFVRLLRFSSDGTRLLSADDEGELICWDSRTWQRASSCGANNTCFVSVSPDGRLAVAASAVGQTSWWETGPSSTLVLPEAPSRVGQLYWWNTASAELLAPGDGHRAAVAGAAFSPEGGQAASVAEDGTVALWDVSSLKPIYGFKGHMNGAHGVAFSPDGRRIATGSNDRDAVKLWDLSTRRELVMLWGKGSLFSFVAFSPDGNWLAASGVERQLHLWHAPSWEEIKAAEKKSKSVASP